MKYIHVVFIVHSFGIGGLENVVANLANRLDPTRFRASIISLTNNLDSCARLTRKDIKCVVIQKRNGNDYLLPFRLAAFLKKEKADVLHTHGWGTFLEGIVAAKLSGVEVIIHAEHGTDHLEKARRRVAYRMGALVVQKIVAVCETIRERFIREYHIPEGKFHTIRNGVDTDFFRQDMQLRKSTRRELGYSEHDVVIGTIGRFCAVKDYPMLLRAVALVVQKNSMAHLLMIGDGPDMVDLKRLAEKLGLEGNIRFLGMRDDRLRLLNAMDVFALTSVSEGLPITLLEAMSVQLPVIATNVGGIHELVTSRNEGVLVESQNPHMFANELEQLLLSTDLRIQMGRTGQQRVLSHFSLGSMVHAYEEVYREHVAHRRKPFHKS